MKGDCCSLDEEEEKWFYSTEEKMKGARHNQFLRVLCSFIRTSPGL